MILAAVKQARGVSTTLIPSGPEGGNYSRNGTRFRRGSRAGDAVLRDIRNCVQDEDEKWKGRRGVFAVANASADAAEPGVNQPP
jgi:hypothetical protein